MTNASARPQCLVIIARAWPAVVIVLFLVSLFAVQMENEAVRQLDGEVVNENFFDNSNLVIYTYLL